MARYYNMRAVGRMHSSSKSESSRILSYNYIALTTNAASNWIDLWGKIDHISAYAATQNMGD